MDGMKILPTALLTIAGCGIQHKGRLETEDPQVRVVLHWCSEFENDEEEHKRCKSVMLDFLEKKARDDGRENCKEGRGETPEGI